MAGCTCPAEERAMLTPIPLLIVPLAISNILVFITPGLEWTAALASFALPSGATWAISLSDAFTAFTLLVLFFELMKATRISARSIIDHMLSLLLLIAAVVAVLAGAMLTRQSVFTRSLEAEQLRVQGTWLLQGALQASRQQLWDARRKEVLTRLDQPWARPFAGVVEGRLDDEQGKFNLRNLVSQQQPDVAQLQSFQRLCQLLGIDPNTSQRISQRVLASYAQRAGGSDVSSLRSTSPE
eukprot:gene4808-6140_t